MTVDVRHAQVSRFADSQPGRVTGQQDHSVFGIGHTFDELGGFLIGENHGEPLGPFPEGDVPNHPGLAQGHFIEESEGTHGLVEGTPGNLLFIDQIELIITNVLQSQLVGRLAEVGAELIDVIGVGVDGAVGEVADAHIFGHALDVGVAASCKGSHT